MNSIAEEFGMGSVERLRAAGAVEIFSDGTSAQPNRALKLCGRAAVRLTERRAEMTVTGEAEIHAQRGQVFISDSKVQPHAKRSRS